jgi:transposase
MELKANMQLIRNAVSPSGTTVTEIYGVGPIVAAFLVGYSGDITRFASAGHYASYNGTAPIEMSSAGSRKHRLSLRGNRKLNHAIHMAAVTKSETTLPVGSTTTRNETKAKTNKEALRALKRRVSDAVCKQLVAEQN